MLPNAGLSAATAGLPVDLRRFSWMSRLTTDYAFDFARLAPFYNGNPADPAAWREAIARTQAHDRPRGAVADVISAQQRRRRAPLEAVAATEQLRDTRTVAVVTGQQAGLFGGPLYTLLKAITAIQLAERVRREQHVPAVAIFWVHDEDHDWDEVRGCTVLDPDTVPKDICLPAPAGTGEPVVRITLDSAIDAALAGLQALLPPTEFTPKLLDDLKRAYHAGSNLPRAFAEWMESLLGPLGLVVYESSDPAAKPFVADIFAREVSLAGQTSRRAADAGAAMVAAGYHAQVAAVDGTLALFDTIGVREPIRVEGGTAAIGERTESLGDLEARARRAPAEFSPNVLLRSVVQDTLFPTICYVGGPSEVAYFGQLKPVYETFGVPMPLIYPRASVTLLDANAARFLSRHDLPIETLRAQDEAVLNDLLEAALPPAVDAALSDALRTVEERLGTVASAVTAVDATLEGAARSTLTRMQDDLKKLQAKVVQAAKRKDDTLRRQFKHAQAQAFPGGAPQERAVGFVHFLNKYGPSLVDRLRQDVPTDLGTHWILTP